MKNKDLKAQLDTAKIQIKNLNEFIIEQRKAYEATIKSMYKRIDSLYSDLQKSNARINELEVENKMLKDKIVEKDKEIDELKLTVSNLTARLKKDSTNSSKPSSTDGFNKKIHNSREKSTKKPGGQFGHTGHGLELFQNPSEIIEIKDEKCDCGKIILYNPNCLSAKQKVDIEILTKITEYQVFEGICEGCGKRHTSEFPDEIINTVKYGENLKSLVAMLSNEGMVSISRTVEMVSGLTDNKINLSEGTVVNINYELAKNCEPIVEEIKDALIKANVLFVDETGVRINGKLKWVHTVCTDDTTLYMVDAKRGNEATAAIDILPYFVGILMHDHFKAYYKYTTMDHAECNAHIIRYLKNIIEIFQRTEAEELLTFLVEANNTKKNEIINGRPSFTAEKIDELENKYSDILERWQKKYQDELANLKVSKYHNEEKCLIKRLIEYKEEHLRFIKDFQVPFDNNTAERALRMIKTKSKVSGGFRSEKGSSSFAKIRSVIATAKKRGENVYQLFGKLFSGKEITLTS
ncbi:MAG: IS66 family transposase [Planctomycetes bacterium]|nr:IS66 family transposase [Planctomycetota bacterium]